MMARGARVATIFGKTTGETSYFLPLQQQECEDDEDDAGAGADGCACWCVVRLTDLNYGTAAVDNPVGSSLHHARFQDRPRQATQDAPQHPAAAPDRPRFPGSPVAQTSTGRGCPA
jgi:hypothetical protein